MKIGFLFPGQGAQTAAWEVFWMDCTDNSA